MNVKREPLRIGSREVMPIENLLFDDIFYFSQIRLKLMLSRLFQVKEKLLFCGNTKKKFQKLFET